MKTTIFGCAVIALACTASTTIAIAQPDVQQLADRWTQAYNTHDRRALANVYAPDAKLMMHGSQTIAGRDSIEAFWAGDMQEGNPLTLLTVTNTVDGVDMKLVHGNYRVIDRDDGGLLGSGRFAHLWQRSGNGWQLERDLWNQPWGNEARDVDSVNVQMLADRWTEAYNTHDRNALQNLYAEDGALMMHGAPTISGRGDIGDFWAQDFEQDNPITVLSVTHGVDGIDMVLAHGNYEVIGRADGTVLGLGRFAHIWYQTPSGEWLLDRDLWIERREPFELD